jgi:hypothetical protein
MNFPLFSSRQISLIAATLILALGLGVLTPSLTYAAPPAQTAPVENSIFPALLQVALIVLVTEGIKSLSRALGGTNADGTPKIDLSGKAAALAYIAVGVLVYIVQIWILPNLPADIAAQLTDFLSALAVIVGGSGLFSMTSALRVTK